MLVVRFTIGLSLAVIAIGAQTANESGKSIVSALRAGKLDEAKKQLKAALQASPRDATLWTLNGMAEAQSGNPAGALVSYKKALNLAPRYLPALEGAGEIGFRQHDQTAVPLLERAAEIQPDDPTVHAMLGDLAARRGDCASAVVQFARGGKLIGASPVALQQQGACLVKLRRPAEAIAPFRQLVDLHPSELHARFNLALAQSLAGETADVLRTLEPLVGAGTADAESLDLASEAYEGTGDTPRAVAALRQAIVLNPDASSYYVEFANLCLAHNSFATGIDMLDAGLRRQPRSASLYLARGVLHIQLAQYESGEQDFRTAQSLDPSVDFGAVAAGLAELQQNNFAEAEKKLQNHIETRPKDAFAWYLLGETLYRGGASPQSKMFDRAVAAARQSVELEPGFSLGRDLLGRLYLQKGDLKEAVEQSRRASAADPNDQTALYHLILALRKSEQMDEVSALADKLNTLKAKAREKDENERKYRLFDTTTPLVTTDP